MKAAKEKLRIQKRLGEMKRAARQQCAICGTTFGMKTAREATGLRCGECFQGGRTNLVTDEYERLKARLGELNRRNG